MTFDDLTSIEWESFSATAQWAKLLHSLLALAPLAGTTGQRGQLADALDAFADHCSSPDLEIIIKLDRLARRAARALPEHERQRRQQVDIRAAAGCRQYAEAAWPD